ncbi:MAG: DNA adenine methylase [Chloroflexota bacterium]|nr:DNA adenine methylase [Chloroflexota bacterium]MDE2682536.1 DNA adenine methylase [Chloroflexota bacterium]
MIMQPRLFDGDAPGYLFTEGIKYIGSKSKIIPYILQIAQGLGGSTVFDGFSGTTRVSQAFAKSGYRVICNDIAPWSEVFGTCYLLSKKPASEYVDLINHLNGVVPVDGWFTEHYGGYPNGGCAVQQDGLKKPWQVHNTRKLDAIRQEIEILNLPPEDKAVVLSSLILALDRVDNTVGHYVSYLKDWSSRSYDSLVLRVPNLFESMQDHSVLRCDISEIASSINADITYLDPPYGSNNEKMPPSRVRYASYYHVWASVCLFDDPAVFGRAKRRSDSTDSLASSAFEEFRKSVSGRYIAVEAIDETLNMIQSQWIILSYSSGGRATAEELRDVIDSNGKLIDVVSIDHKKNVMASMKWTHQWINDCNEFNKEFLFLIEKR